MLTMKMSNSKDVNIHYGHSVNTQEAKEKCALAIVKLIHAQDFGSIVAEFPTTAGVTRFRKKVAEALALLNSLTKETL